MKEKILMLIIGVLIGAIITSICFVAFYKPTSNENRAPNNQMQNVENFMPGNRQKGQIPNEAGNALNGELPSGEAPSDSMTPPNGMTPPDGEIPSSSEAPFNQNSNEQKANSKTFEKRTKKTDTTNTNVSAS